MGQSKPRQGSAGLSRRNLLALGPVCLAAAVSACAAPDTAAPDTAAPDTAAPTGAPPRNSTGAVEPTAPAPSTSRPPATKTTPRFLTTTDGIPVGGGKVVSAILVVQPIAGLFKAFDARCPHLAAIVSPPKDGVITCREHGSKFVDLDGSLLQGPAPRGLKEISIVVQGRRILAG